MKRLIRWIINWLYAEEVEGAVPYWRCNTKPDIIHAFTSETLAGIERGLKHFKK